MYAFRERGEDPRPFRVISGSRMMCITSASAAGRVDATPNGSRPRKKLADGYGEFLDGV